MDQEHMNQKRGKVDLFVKLAPSEGDRTRNKRELIKRLTRIEHLARQKNYAEIEKLLQENYV
jgi:hypothetical protein